MPPANRPGASVPRESKRDLSARIVASVAGGAPHASTTAAGPAHNTVAWPSSRPHRVEAVARAHHHVAGAQVGDRVDARERCARSLRAARRRRWGDRAPETSPTCRRRSSRRRRAATRTRAPRRRRRAAASRRSPPRPAPSAARASRVRRPAPILRAARRAAGRPGDAISWKPSTTSSAAGSMLSAPACATARSRSSPSNGAIAKPPHRRRGQHLEVRAHDDAERAVRADVQLAHVVAGHVLDDHPAGLGERSVGQRGGRADQEVARPSVCRAARPGPAGGKRAADGRARRERRVERKKLAVLARAARRAPRPSSRRRRRR